MEVNCCFWLADVEVLHVLVHIHTFEIRHKQTFSDQITFQFIKLDLYLIRVVRLM